MLKRLMVVAAALALVFVFVPTASAQDDPLTLPTECVGQITGDLSEECRDALGQLLEPLDGTVGEQLGEQGQLPESCGEVLNLDLDATLTTGQLLDLLQCLTDLAELDGDEEPAGAIDEPYDAGYGYDDYGYDIGYDGDIPEGGVDSGFGATGSDDPGAPLVARGAALLALVGVLTTGLLVMRRRHGS